MNTFMLREVSCMLYLLKQHVSSSHRLNDGFVEPREVASCFYLRAWDCLFHNRHKDTVPGIPHLLDVVGQY